MLQGKYSYIDISSTSLKYVFITLFVVVTPTSTNTMHHAPNHRYSNRTSNKPESSSSTWLHAKNFIILCLAVCLSSSIPFLIYFFSSFHRLFESSCVITTSLTLLLTYETLVEQNQFVLKYIHIDFVPLFWDFFGVFSVAVAVVQCKCALCMQCVLPN